jgi:tetrahydromethanopterin S-methyltransferase subunit G
VSEPVSIETRVSRNTNDIEALYGLIQGFEGRTRVSFAKVNQRFDDLDGKVDGIVGRVDDLDGKVDGIVGRVDDLDGKVDGLIGRVDGIEGKVDGLAGQLSEVLELLRKQN